MWVWDGSVWRPAPPHLSADGEWLWTGTQWEKSSTHRAVDVLIVISCFAMALSLVMLPGALMTVGDVAPENREGLTSATLFMIMLFNFPAIGVGLSTAIVGRHRLSARIVGWAAFAVGMFTAATEVLLFAA